MIGEFLFIYFDCMGRDGVDSMATYDVSDIARFFVRKYIADGNPATNMKLQKMLYYAWVEYYKKTQNYLFRDDIYAWKYGPVVPKVYREYRIYAGMPILKSEDSTDIDEETAGFLTDFADRHKDFTASQLMNLTHKDNSPWRRVYREGEKYTKIPFDIIIAVECRA